MLELIPELRVYFDHLQDRLRTFSKYSYQAESWFKAELVTFLDAAMQRRRIIAFDREFRLANNKRVDIRIDTSHGRHWVELKHILIGMQKGQRWCAKDYFIDSQKIAPDVDKLMGNESPGGRWLLLLFTTNPGKDEWNIGIEQFHSKWSPRKIVPMTDPDDFPDSYFMGLLEVE